MKKIILLAAILFAVIPFSTTNAIENTISDDWIEFESTINEKQSNEPIKILFNEDIDTSTINNENVFVAMDILLCIGLGMTK